MLQSTIEIGHFLIIIALVLSAWQFFVLVVAGWRGREDWIEIGVLATPIVFFLMLFAFITILLAFVRSDFSLLLVAQHSHSLKPLLYKITGVWGNHEGSMMLWILCLCFFSMLIFIFRERYPLKFSSYLFSSQSLLIFSFLCFLIFTSNPFIRLIDPPLEGMGLNPVLQDPALAFHPPMLYLGYVGLCVSFSFGIAALIDGKIDKQWAAWIRPWTLFSWICLTLGIALGSWWAYYELGWGGYWFWDPVENSSLMPWLAATALLHSNSVLLKRNTFKGWTVLLALFAFTFSLIGAFIVRSGIIASVHAFAVDPERGIYLLMILFLVFMSAFSLFLYRVFSFSSKSAFSLVSRESGLVLNNLLLCVSAVIIFLGTIWPFIIEFFLNEQISVGAPFFNLSLAPFAFIIGIFLPLGANVSWGKSKIFDILKRMQIAFYLSVLGSFLIAITFNQFGALLLLGVALSVWVIGGALTDLFEKFFSIRNLNTFNIFSSFVLNRLEIGKNVSHIGVGFLIFGITMVSSLETEVIKEVEIGEQFKMGQFEVILNGVERKRKSNYFSDIASLTFISNNEQFEINPEKRFYSNQNVITSEVALKQKVTKDLYAVLGDPRIDEESQRKTWIVRIYIKPFISFLWFGAMLIALGGILSLFTHRKKV